MDPNAMDDKLYYVEGPQGQVLGPMTMIQILEGIAAEAGISLTDRHWVVLTFVREDAVDQGEPPGVRRITKLTDVSMKEIYQLFPKGPGILASKLAGYGKPQGCV